MPPGTRLSSHHSISAVTPFRCLCSVTVAIYHGLADATADTSQILLAISDDETSDVGEIEVPIAPKRAAAAAALQLDDDDNEMLDVFGDDEAKDEQDKDEVEDEDEDEDLEEDECACFSLLRRAPSLFLVTNSSSLGLLSRKSWPIWSSPT